MGLLKFFARLGAVGGTARIIAKQYLNYRKIYPNRETHDDSEIFQLIVRDRYKILKNNEIQSTLLQKTHTITGLTDFVIEILKLEANFAENTYENKKLFEKIIEEELLKKGVLRNDV